MPDDDLERFFAALGEQTGTPPVEPEEVLAVLDLARVVARGAERRYAPVAAYAAGLVIGAGTPAAERAGRVRALLTAVERLLEARADDGSRRGEGGADT